jgi:hypothetical protein
MLIGLSAQTKWGDTPGLVAFFGDHAFQHVAYAQLARKTYSRDTPLFDVADQRALAEWIATMDRAKKKERAEAPEALRQWLEKHNALHIGEVVAMGINATVDLSTVDLADPGAFDDWMNAHAALHALQDRKLGI